MAISPTQRTLKWCRDRGWTTQVVERWNSFAKIRQDLFGVIDVVAMDLEAGQIRGIQTTSGSNDSARVTKMLALLFGRVMPAKTKTGSSAYMDVLGFQEFLSRAEKDRLQRMGDKNLFSKFLPYAIWPLMS